MSFEAFACPICAGPMRALETRSAPGAKRRRRACVDRACAGRLTTIELQAPIAGSIKARCEDMVLVPRALLDQLTKIANGGRA